MQSDYHCPSFFITATGTSRAKRREAPPTLKEWPEMPTKWPSAQISPRRFLALPLQRLDGTEAVFLGQEYQSLGFPGFAGLGVPQRDLCLRVVIPD
ncbi:hypothetical protein PCASD_00709 [Puccinia coronata f. sp. avenae]|uniref:Uncharacterized protein n=1 Tax=Puccinia coronata f. sp. avenae TaxID=200324 RepID=A0A2N5VL92_9BASI|nr:hypothetical protein PCASD_00709 [Puccinia coronata f. sp. avenae]